MLRTYTNHIGEPSLNLTAVRQRLAAITQLWSRRIRTRRDLAALNDDQLHDIGLTRDDIRREVARQFWSPWPRA